MVTSSVAQRVVSKGYNSAAAMGARKVALSADELATWSVDWTAVSTAYLKAATKDNLLLAAHWVAQTVYR